MSIFSWINEVRNAMTIAQSVETMVLKVAADLRAVSTDPAVVALANELETDVQTIIHAVQANTPADPAKGPPVSGGATTVGVTSAGTAP